MTDEERSPAPWDSWIDWGLDRRGEILIRRDLLPHFLEEVRALRDERDSLRKRLDCNQCNSGHETLPLALWDCPECVRIKEDALRARVVELEAKAARWERTCRDIQGATTARAEKAEAERDRRDGWLKAAIARAEKAEARVEALEEKPCPHESKTRYVGCGGMAYWICDNCESVVGEKHKYPEEDSP